MSDSNGPVRRRRIAGEAAPAAPAQKPVVKKAARKPATKKAEGKASPAVPSPAVKKTPATTKAPGTTKSPASKKPPASKNPAGTVKAAAGSVATPARKPAVTKPVVAPKAPGRTSVTTPADDTSRSDRPAGSRPSRRDLLWLVPATLVTIAALVAGAWCVVAQPGSGTSGGALDTSRRQASSAAASASEAIFSFRYDQLDQHLTASKALMTPAFAKDFDKIAPALTELAPQRKIVVQAVARESAALPCGDDCSDTRADVLVFVDQARLVGDDAQPTVFANRIKVSMVKGKDGWLVSDIRAL